MNLRKQFISLFVPLLFLSSCNFKSKDKAPVYIQPQLLDTIFSSSFEGVIPCPDCPGIETTIKIFNDSTISRTVYYQGKNELPQTKVGTWVLKDSIFEAKFDRDKLFYKIKSGNVILRVGSDFKEVQGQLADDYVLRRAKPFDLNFFMGDYYSGVRTDDHKKLVLNQLKKNLISVELTTYFKNDSIAKCKFHLEAKLNKENMIEVPIGNKKDSVQPLMKILFTIKEAHVFYEYVPKDSIPLKCKDSLHINYQGTYLKR